MCWWQGLDNAPEIVKACVDSVRRNAGNREVIIITDKNVREYVSFPSVFGDDITKEVYLRRIFRIFFG